jgi:hypothetical protein
VEADAANPLLEHLIGDWATDDLDWVEQLFIGYAGLSEVQGFFVRRLVGWGLTAFFQIKMAHMLRNAVGLGIQGRPPL